MDKPFRFADPVTNVCAGPNNPHRLGYFVRYARGGLIEMTDKAGAFWSADAEVIFAGHLEYSECERLFQPIWEKRFGPKE